MEWILIAGALCLSSHHDICVKQDGPDFRITGALSPMSEATMEGAVVVAEAVTKMRDEDTADAAKRGSGGTTGPIDAYAFTAQCDFAGDRTATNCHPPVQASPILGTAPSNVLMNSAPYGMSKEEFGAFIEERVGRAIFKAQMGGIPGNAK